MSSIQTKQPIFIWAGIAIALLFWVLDSFLDSYVFGSTPFLTGLFPLREPDEIWERVFVGSLLIAFGVFADTVTKKRTISDENLRVEVLEHREAEGQLLRSEQSLHEFYNISSSVHQDFNTRLERLLRLGCQRFDMDIGILSNINGEEYKVVDAVSPDNGLEKGTIFPLGKTYCQITINTEDPVSYTYMAESDASSLY